MKNILISFLMIFTVQAGAIDCTDIFKQKDLSQLEIISYGARIGFVSAVAAGGAILAFGPEFSIGVGDLTLSTPIVAVALSSGILSAALFSDSEGKYLDPKKAKQIVNDPIDLEYLIKKGLDVNAVDKKGNTLLHYAENIESVKVLLKNGANIYIRNKNKENALQYHSELDNVEVKEYLFHFIGQKRRNSELPW